MTTTQMEMVALVVKLGELMVAQANAKPEGVEQICKEIQWEKAMNQLLDVADAIRAR